MGGENVEDIHALVVTYELVRLVKNKVLDLMRLIIDHLVNARISRPDISSSFFFNLCFGLCSCGFCGSLVIFKYLILIFVNLDMFMGFDENDGDDDIREEFLCPFCSEYFDIVGLCCHIDEEHPMEAKNGV